MKIGNVSIDNNVFLAPMAGITDMPFRILCKKQGCGMVYSEMVSAKGIYYDSTKSILLTEVDEREMPVSVQIFGSDPSIMAKIAERLDKSNASIIDINMGCPTPKIIKNGEGCALMQKPYLVAEIVRAVSNATDKPVTVKIRKGWDEDNVNAVEIAEIAVLNGAKAVTVHGRTREQFYSGNVDLEIIKKVKDALPVPVIGNGDIFSPEDAKRMLESTGCDAIMIGRGARGNPWIFKRVLEYLENGILLPEPALQEKIDMAIRHMKMLIELKGERTGICEMRKHIAWYIKGIRHAAQIKERLFRLTKMDDIIELLKCLQ